MRVARDEALYVFADALDRIGALLGSSQAAARFELPTNPRNAIAEP